MKLLLYCTKAKPILVHHIEYCSLAPNEYIDCGYEFRKSNELYENELNGKIVAECDFEVEEIKWEFMGGYLPYGFGIKSYQTLKLTQQELLKRSCLTDRELRTYCLCEGYAIHIKNLKIFDDPKELNEVYKIENIGGMLFTTPLEKAPRNIMRISVNHWDYATYNPDDINILLPRSPEEMCRILNGQQTVIVIKKVLKEMLNNA